MTNKAYISTAYNSPIACGILVHLTHSHKARDIKYVFHKSILECQVVEVVHMLLLEELNS